MSVFSDYYLGLIDLFMLHDSIIPKYLGMSAKPLFIGYGCAQGRGHRHILGRLILKTDYLIAIIALAFFALSLVVDVFPVPHRKQSLVD